MNYHYKKEFAPVLRDGTKKHTIRAKAIATGKTLKQNMKKVKRRAFTEKQLELLEQYNYLYKKFWRTGLEEEDCDNFERLRDKVRKFIDLD